MSFTSLALEPASPSAIETSGLTTPRRRLTANCQVKLAALLVSAIVPAASCSCSTAAGGVGRRRNQDRGSVLDHQRSGGSRVLVTRIDGNLAIDRRSSSNVNLPFSAVVARYFRARANECNATTAPAIGLAHGVVQHAGLGRVRHLRGGTKQTTGRKQDGDECRFESTPNHELGKFARASRFFLRSNRPPKKP